MYWQRFLGGDFMDVRNCKECGRLFNYLTGPPLCPGCAKKLDDVFEQVKEYVYDHPRVDMQEVSAEFDVSIAQIRQWIREERLAFAEDSMIGLECERCGTIIRTGRFCKSCKDKIAKGLTDLYPEEKLVEKHLDPHDIARMRFLK